MCSFRAKYNITDATWWLSKWIFRILTEHLRLARVNPVFSSVNRRYFLRSASLQFDFLSNARFFLPFFFSRINFHIILCLPPFYPFYKNRCVEFFSNNFYIWLLNWIFWNGNSLLHPFRFIQMSLGFKYWWCVRKASLLLHFFCVCVFFWNYNFKFSHLIDNFGLIFFPFGFSPNVKSSIQPFS